MRMILDLRNGFELGEPVVVKRGGGGLKRIGGRR